MVPLPPNCCLTVVVGSTTQYKTFKRELSHVDRAILDGQTAGFVKIHCKKGGDQILGATVVGEHAGDLISEITLAMQSKTGIGCVCVCAVSTTMHLTSPFCVCVCARPTGLGKVAAVIHPYPTQAEAIRQTGDMYNRTRLTKTVKSLFNGLMKWRR